ncbi:amino acid permease [Acinetobacter sp.]|uniref:APC family permease n=1 Tax=Acinetobacter sp. TaxID=472 RepID=UPI00333F0CBA
MINSNGLEKGNDQAELKRTLSLIDLIAYGLSYISLVAALVTFGIVWDAANGLISLAYLLGAICIYFTAKSYSTMAAIHPNAGSVYSYTKMALGPFAGFLAGWLILLDYLLIPALIFILMAIGIQTLVPEINRPTWIIILVIFSSLVNWRGIQVSTKISLTSVFIQILVVLGIIIFSYKALQDGVGAGAITLAPLYTPENFNFGHIFTATAICIISFLGFDAITTLSEEVKGDSTKLIGKAIMIVLFVSAFSFVTTTLFIGNLTKGFQIKDSSAAIYEILDHQIGSWSSITFAWITAVFVSFTNALPMQAGVARVMFAMGRNKQLPASLGLIHPKRKIPHVAMLVSTMISLCIALMMQNKVDMLALFVSFGALAGFLMLHISVLVHLGIKNNNRLIYSHIIVPVLGIFTVLALFYCMHHDALILGMIWTLAGIAYGLYLHKKEKIALAITE